MQCRATTANLARCGQALGPNSHKTCTRNASKWDLLLSMGVFTLLASNIKGKMFQFACTNRVARPVWIRPKAQTNDLTLKNDDDSLQRHFISAGVPDPPDDLPKAFVVKKQGSTLTEEDIIAFVQGTTSFVEVSCVRLYLLQTNVCQKAGDPATDCSSSTHGYWRIQHFVPWLMACSFKIF